jgi:hypothetical protein
MAQPKIPRGRMLKVTGSTVKGVRFNKNGTVDVIVGGTAGKRNPKKKRKVKAKRKPAKNRKPAKKKRKAAKKKK